MDELAENTDNCSGFAPNRFKKEKCQHCGKPWTEHKGLLTDEQLKGFLAQRQKVIDEQKAKEAEAKEKARAKAIAKRKATQAVEDEWFFDDSKDAEAMLDDDEEAFRMFCPDEFASAAIERAPQVQQKAPKIKNLIDWGACDVPEERSSDSGGAGCVAAAAATGLMEQDVALPGSSAFPVGMLDGSPSFATASRDPPPSAPAQPMVMHSGQPDMVLQEELLTEIQHLRQMLADANEEKNIQVAIVQDEVLEKQQFLEDLMRQHAEMEGQLQDARAKLDTLRATAAQAAGERDEARVLAGRSSAEAQELRAEVERLRAELAQAQAGAGPRTQVGGPELPASVAGTLAELRDLCSRTQEMLMASSSSGGGSGSGSSSSSSQVPDQHHHLAPRAAGETIADAGKLEAELRSLHAAVAAAHGAAQQVSAQRQQAAAEPRSPEERQGAAQPPLLPPPPVKRGISPTAPTPPHRDELPHEALAEAQKVSRHCARALREMRAGAEEQLALISKRIRTSPSLSIGESPQCD